MKSQESPAIDWPPSMALASQNKKWENFKV